MTPLTDSYLVSPWPRAPRSPVARSSSHCYSYKHALNTTSRLDTTACVYVPERERDRCNHLLHRDSKGSYGSRDQRLTHQYSAHTHTYTIEQPLSNACTAASEQQQAREHHRHRNEPHSLAASLPLTLPPSLPHHHRHHRRALVRSLFSRTHPSGSLFNHLLYLSSSLSLSLSISLVLEVGQNCLIESCDSHTHQAKHKHTHSKRSRLARLELSIIKASLLD